jgi:hypothetical protein
VVAPLPARCLRGVGGAPRAGASGSHPGSSVGRTRRVRSSKFGPGDATECASVYFAGGLFFSTGGYVSLLQVINAPRREGAGEGRLVTGRWRWWSYEPMRVDWLSTFVLFAGTLVFAVDLLDSFLQGLNVQQVNRLIWVPDVIGCALFLLSGHLGFVEIRHGRPCLRPHNLGWRIVAVNQLGSVPLHGLRARCLYPTRHRQSRHYRHRQLGHPHRRLVLLPRRPPPTRRTPKRLAGKMTEPGSLGTGGPQPVPGDLPATWIRCASPPSSRLRAEPK